MQVIKCLTTFLTTYSNNRLSGTLSEDCCISKIIFDSGLCACILISQSNGTLPSSSQMNIQGTKNVVYEWLTLVLISHEIEIVGGKSAALIILAISCHPYLEFCLKAVRMELHVLCSISIRFLKNFLHDLFSGACSCRTAPRQGCSVLWGSVQLPLMSNNTASASVVVTPAETTLRGITTHHIKKSTKWQLFKKIYIYSVGLPLIFKDCVLLSRCIPVAYMQRASCNLRDNVMCILELRSFNSEYWRNDTPTEWLM